MNKYKELKEQIESTHGPESEPPRMTGTKGGLANGQKEDAKGASKSSKIGKPATGDAMFSQAYFDEVVEALKASILKELSAIREDIARLAKSK